MATAAKSVTAGDCEEGANLPVSFSWHGKTVSESEQLPHCPTGIPQGASVVVYVASNDPSNVGPNANWILNPDTHDPFDFIGPNGLRGFVATVGGLVLGAALISLLAAGRARRRSSTN